MMAEWLPHFLGYLVAAAAVYAGIRADLASIRVRAEMAAEAAKGAHQRIDSMLSKGGNHG